MLAYVQQKLIEDEGSAAFPQISYILAMQHEKALRSCNLICRKHILKDATKDRKALGVLNGDFNNWKLRGLLCTFCISKLEARDHLLMNGGLDNCLMGRKVSGSEHRVRCA